MVRATKSFGSRLIGAAALAFGMLMLPSPAAADIIYNSSLRMPGQGFGNEPRLLTVQETGKGDNVESACVAGGPTIQIGPHACISDSQVFQGNGVTNLGGDEVQPKADNQKYGIPTIGEMGFNAANDIGLLFNATEPGGNGIAIDDVTLKFYSPSGELLAAIDGSHTFASTKNETGNGVAGFTFEVDADQQAYLNSTIFSRPDFRNIQLALETTLSNAQGGPESWYAYNLGRSEPPTSVPAPPVAALFLAASLGIGWYRRRRRAAESG